jgi:hypothetical protein
LDIEILKTRRNAAGRTFCDAIIFAGKNMALSPKTRPIWPINYDI